MSVIGQISKRMEAQTSLASTQSQKKLCARPSAAKQSQLASAEAA